MMRIAANFAFAAVMVLTLRVVPRWQTTIGARGPDRSAVAIHPLLCGARWFPLSIAPGAPAVCGAFPGLGVVLLIMLDRVCEMIAAFVPGALSGARKE